VYSDFGGFCPGRFCPGDYIRYPIKEGIRYRLGAQNIAIVGKDSVS